MAIKVQYRRLLIECSTEDEFRAVMRAVREEEEERLRQGHTPLAQLAAVLTGGPHWDAERFWTFIGALGEAQRKILGLLVARGHMTDEELRTALGEIGKIAWLRLRDAVRD